VPDSAQRRIFVLDDDSVTRRIVEAALTQESFVVHGFGTKAHGVAAAQREAYDLYLLDVMLPDGDGVEICRLLRSRTAAPIVMLTSRGDLDDVVGGLEAGADDYIVKPFRIGELVARVRAQLRRAGELKHDRAPDDLLRLGDLTVDRAIRDAVVRGERARLSQREFEVLDYLARRHGRNVERDVLMEAVWGPAEEISEKILAVYIRRLRCKIEVDPEAPQHLHTVRGFGYRLE
jgi:DNA-binding response OmpR family regulator